MLDVNIRCTWIAQGISVSLTISGPCYRGFVIHLALILSDKSLLPSQGTRVLEDQEIRLRFCRVTADAPEQQVSSSILKYTGTGRAPEWEDIEQGSVFSFNDFAEHSSQADKFEKLCSVRADISTAPYQTKPGYKCAMSYTRSYEVILLVGLTELKAQIGWIDSATVSSREISSCSPL